MKQRIALAALLMVATSETRFLIRGQWVSFARDAAKHLTISKACRQPDGRYACAAYRAFRKLAGGGLPLGREGAPDPGAILCVERSGGKIAIGTDESGNQNSFCFFSDGSLISTGSLRAAASGH